MTDSVGKVARPIPLIMGIINTTPDSFSDGGRFADLIEATEHAKKLIEDGADIIDIGGESTRPGATAIDIETEISRTIPLIKEIRKFSKIPISIDTRKPEIAELAVNAGANMWNDVSALTYSENSIQIAASLNVPVILMHHQGSPENMQAAPHYDDVVKEVLEFLSLRMGHAIIGGVKRENIVLDIGIGFGKTLKHNLLLLNGLDKFLDLGRPLLLGASRKSFIGKIDENAEPSERIGGSVAAAIWGAQNGASILRVHDVKETRQALKVLGAIYQSAVD